MKSVLPTRKCPRVDVKHTKVVAVGYMFAAPFRATPFQICSRHIESYVHKTDTFRVILLPEFLKYPCYRKHPDQWCGEREGHYCEVKKSETMPMFDEDTPPESGRKSRNNLF